MTATSAPNAIGQPSGADATATPRVTLSVVTATYNAAAVLPRLIASLIAQTDHDFEWIVADGGSIDATLQLIREAGKVLNVRVDSRPDFGIYDALNRAVSLAHGEYYIVVGADDELFPHTISQYEAACRASRKAFITARIESNGIEHGARKLKWEWINRMHTYISGHAVGTAIRRDLHNRLGPYSNQFPLAADQLFVITAIHGGATVDEVQFVAGRYDKSGASGVDKIRTLVEEFLVQLAVGHSMLPQLALLNYRLIRRSLRIPFAKRSHNE